MPEDAIYDPEDDAPIESASVDDPDAFVRENTALVTPSLLPELPLYLASEVTPLWHATEDALAGMGLPSPYWAFAWAGGQALARHVLDHPGSVAGANVLDFAAGGGVVTIAAMLAGADMVTAADIDPFAGAALRLNAEYHGVSPHLIPRDIIGTDDGWDVVLAGDIFYEQPLAGNVLAWFEKLRARGAEVLVGDPGRTYLPMDKLELIETYQVPTTRELEDADVRRTNVWRLP